VGECHAETGSLLSDTGQEPRGIDREQVVRNILNSLPEFIVVLDREGVILEVNEAWQQSARQSGAAEECVCVGANYLDVCLRASQTGDKEAERALQGIRSVLDGKRVSFVMEYRCHSPAHQRFFLMHVKRLVDSRGRVVISHVDITDRHRAEEELTRHNRRLDLLARVSQCLLVSSQADAGDMEPIFDDISRQLGLEIYLFYEPFENAAALRLRSYRGLRSTAREAFQEIPLSEFLCGRVAQSETRMVVENLQNANFDGCGRYTEIGAKSFAAFPLVVGDTLRGVLAFLSDSRSRFRRGEVRLIQTICDQIATTLERNRLIGELKRSEARFRAAVDAVSSLMWTNTAEGLMVGEQPDWAEFTGQSYEDYQGYGWADAVHPDDAQATLEAWNEAVAERKTFVFEHRLHRKDGQWRICSVRAVPVLNDNGSILEWVGVHTDITENKLAESELRDARERAEAANRAKSIFLANMSHEIRSPMTAILGYVDLLQVDTREGREMIETIRRNSQHLLSLINDILDLSRIEAGKFELSPSAFKPRKLVEEVVSLMRVRAADKGLTLVSEFVDNLPEWVQSDAIRIRQILINLVGNAIKFTEQGSVRISLGYRSTDATLRVEITDTGIGISEREQARLFASFEQADNSIARRFGGSGLGLAISQRLAHLLKGRIDVESVPGQGSCFKLILPVNEASGHGSVTLPTRPSASELKHRPALKGLGARVLVVDDRRDIRFLIEHLIKRMGGQVEQCVNGAEAVAKLTEPRLTAAPFDIVLMDMQMPVMDGLTAVRTLRDRGLTCPIIALTANAMTTDRDDCLAAGYTDYLTKPIEADKLARVLQRFVHSADR